MEPRSDSAGGLRTGKPFAKVVMFFALVVTLVVSIFVAYGAGYFHLSSVVAGGPGTKLRVYDAMWMMFVFAPAAWVESEITGQEVRVVVVR